MKEIIELIATIKATAGEFMAVIQDVTESLTDVAREVESTAREFDELNRATLSEVIEELEGVAQTVVGVVEDSGELGRAMTEAVGEVTVAASELQTVADDVSGSVREIGGDRPLEQLATDTDAAEKQMTSLGEAVEAASTEADELDGATLDKLEQEIEASDLAIAALEKSIAKAQGELERIDRTGQSRVQAEIAGAQNRVELLRGKSQHAKEELARLNQSPMQRLQSEIDKTSKRFQDFARKIGTAMAAFGGAITGALALTAKSSMRTTRLFAEFMTILERQYQESDKWKDQFLAGVSDIAAEFGIMEAEILQAAYRAKSAGVETNEVLDALRASAVGAKAGVTDLGEAIGVVTGVTNAYGKENITAKQALDTMFVAVLKGDTDFKKLSATIGDIVPTASALGISFEEVTSAMAALTKSKIETSKAATGLRALLFALIRPTEDAAAVAKALGVEFSASAVRTHGLHGLLGKLVLRLDEVERQGGLRIVDEAQVANQEKKIQSLANKMAELNAKMSDPKSNRQALAAQLAEVSREMAQARAELVSLKQGELVARDTNEALVKLFGSVEAAGTAFSLTKNQGEAFNEVMVAMAERTGAADHAFKVLNENDTGFAFDQATASLASLRDAIGAALMEALEPLLIKITEVVKSIREWVAENPGLTTAIAGITLAAGALVTVLGTLIVSLGVLAGSIVAIKMAGIGAAVTALMPAILALKAGIIAVGVAIAGVSAPVWIAIAAIAAAVALVIVYWDEIIDWTSKAMYEIGSFFWDLGENAKFVWGEIKRWALDMISVLMDKFGGMFDWLAKKLAWLAEKLGLVYETAELTGKGGVSPEEARRRNKERFNDTGGGVKKFATGGIVTRPTLALAGEAGPEAFVPLSGGAIPVTLNLDSLGATAGPGGGTFAPNITIMQQPGESAEVLARRVADVLLRRRG